MYTKTYDLRYVDSEQMQVLLNELVDKIRYTVRVYGDCMVEVKDGVVHVRPPNQSDASLLRQESGPVDS